MEDSGQHVVATFVLSTLHFVGRSGLAAKKWGGLTNHVIPETLSFCLAIWYDCGIKINNGMYKSTGDMDS